ncbi:G1 family glutamic endopeptidase [Kitasatospora sp. LaBMicrA B282]|uniref:G1 family glutamic endopeptidase n=1 Tax=Kitasatospora sp. LaBMicrA B282 TaxID=3420949 RepID=UPI003D0AB4B7
MPAPRRRALTAAAAVAALLAPATPAVADAAAGNAPMIALSPHHLGPHGLISHGTSANWSGYAATSTNGEKFTSVSAEWNEPTGLCTDQDTYSSFWVGLDGDGSNSVEQTGSEVDCSNGQPQYYSWYEMYPAYPKNFSDPVAAGDHFVASVTSNGSGTFLLDLADTTQGWHHSVRKTLRSARLASVEVIAEAPSTLAGPLPLTDFGTVDFTGATANGRPIGDFKPEKIDMATRTHTVLATTSPLDGGSDFSVTWQHS